MIISSSPVFGENSDQNPAQLLNQQINNKINQYITHFEKSLSQQINILDPDKFEIKVEIEIKDTLVFDSSIFLVDSIKVGADGIINRFIIEYPKGPELYTEKRDSLYNLLNKRNVLVESFIAPYLSSAVYLVSVPHISIFLDTSIDLEDYKQSLTTLVSNLLNIRLNEIIPDGFPDIDISKFENLIEFHSKELLNPKDNENKIALQRADIYDQSWAVIIGIDKYQNIPNLDYAVKDAEAVNEMLINNFEYPEENVKLLVNEEASKINIINVISKISIEAGENDRILVFFAGHGETMDLPDGGEMGFLLPVNVNKSNLYASAVRMDDLKDLSSLSESKHMLFLVDACYGGLAAVGTRSLESTNTSNYLGKITNIKSRQIITAGGKTEKVIEKSEWGHSAYTKNLLSALNGELADINEDGYITASELGSYLSEKVTLDSEGKQTPQLRRLTSDEGEFVFFNSSNKK